MLCNYIFQNIIILFSFILFWYFVMRKEPLIVKQDKNKGGFFNGINSWTNTQGWLGLIFGIIYSIISLFEKIPSLSIILSIFGINICNYSS